MHTLDWYSCLTLDQHSINITVNSQSGVNYSNNYESVDTWLTINWLLMKCQSSVYQVSIGMLIKHWSKCWSRVWIRSINQQVLDHGWIKYTPLGWPLCNFAIFCVKNTLLNSSSLLKRISLFKIWYTVHTKSPHKKLKAVPRMLGYYMIWHTHKGQSQSQQITDRVTSEIVSGSGPPSSGPPGGTSTNGPGGPGRPLTPGDPGNPFSPGAPGSPWPRRKFSIQKSNLFLKPANSV